MSQPSPTQQANQAISQGAMEQIQMRMASGEFGVPPDPDLINRAWAELFQSEMRNRPRRDIYNDVCGLWNDLRWHNENNRVLLNTKPYLPSVELALELQRLKGRGVCQIVNNFLCDK